MSKSYSKAFTDTNILIYAYDKRFPNKQNIASSLLRMLHVNNQLVLSTQVLQEFYVTATKKLRLDALKVKQTIHYYQNVEVVNSDIGLIERAIDLSMLFQVSFWDGMIIAAAEKAKCSKLYSEDLNHGQSYCGVLVENPFLVQK